MTLEHLDTILAFVLIITGISLLITALNQAVSALLGLRGTHLRWALATLLGQLDPGLKQHAREISQRVLEHKLISDSVFSGFATNLFSRWRCASAIRQDELIDILRMLAKAPPGQPADASKEPWAAALEKALDELKPEAAQDVVRVATEVKKCLPDDPAKVEQLLAPLLDSAAALPAKIDQWFDSVMDRSAQRFALHMRLWTVAFAVILAFALQLDAFSLFTRLSNDSAVRAQVLASADLLNKRADELGLPSADAPGTSILAMKQLFADHRDELKDLPEPVGFTTVAAGKDWLAAQLKQHNIADTESKWARLYEDLVPQARVRAAADNLNSLVADKLILQFVPQPYPEPFYRDWSPGSRVFWGILASAVLLSFGAPFWFNILKTLSNLRPILADKQQREAEAAQ